MGSKQSTSSVSNKSESDNCYNARFSRNNVLALANETIKFDMFNGKDKSSNVMSNDKIMETSNNSQEGSNHYISIQRYIFVIF